MTATCAGIGLATTALTSGDNINYSLAGVPVALNVAPKTYTVTITATDSSSATESTTISLVVNPAITAATATPSPTIPEEF